MKNFRAGILLILISLILVQSKAYPQNSKSPILEKLDIKSITERMDSLAKGKNDKSGTFSYKEGNIVTTFTKYYAPENFISYSEEDLSKGTFASINGNVNDNLVKHILDRNNPKIEIITYYLNGNVHTIQYYYSDKCLKNNPGATEYPIGTSFTYNKDGTLLNSVNIDNAFKFSIIDVRKLLSRRGKGLIIRGIEGIYSAEICIWKIDYSTPKSGVCNMRINASTGMIITDRKHINNIYIE